MFPEINDDQKNKNMTSDEAKSYSLGFEFPLFFIAMQ